MVLYKCILIDWLIDWQLYHIATAVSKSFSDIWKFQTLKSSFLFSATQTFMTDQPTHIVIADFSGSLVCRILQRYVALFWWTLCIQSCLSVCLSVSYKLWLISVKLSRLIVDRTQKARTTRAMINWYKWSRSVVLLPGDGTHLWIRSSDVM